MSADVIAWLRSEEGEEWSREQAAQFRPQSAAPQYRTTEPANLAEDPCGRPYPSLGEIAAKEECP